MKKKRVKKNHETSTGFTHSANSVTNISDKKHFTITKDSNIEDLKRHILQESKKNNTQAVLVLIKDGSHFLIQEIEKLGKFITDNKIDVTVRAMGNIDFTEMAIVIFCSTYHIFFPEETSIYMSTSELISQGEMMKIVKKMSEILVCDEQDLIKYYNQKVLIEPNTIFDEESDYYCYGKKNMNPIQIDGSYYKRR